MSVNPRDYHVRLWRTRNDRRRLIEGKPFYISVTSKITEDKPEYGLFIYRDCHVRLWRTRNGYKGQKVLLFLFVFIIAIPTKIADSMVFT